MTASALTSLGEIATRMATFDPGNAYSVNYMWGTTAFGYNLEQIKARMPNAPVSSWRMIFDPDVMVLPSYADIRAQVPIASAVVVATEEQRY